MRRILHGVGGVKLQATFDGSRYWVRPDDVELYLLETTEGRTLPSKPKAAAKRAASVAEEGRFYMALLGVEPVAA
ncbi:hypothetical protein [Alienimonas chondri]|uniref:Uncharacterized protein n=1 Tax=Alienimonas chondri TaxID=2681879 RepID=A0ABX1V711_9PLAN|nr:hypothetical protein [Alienimonas chondri]NNJ24030.1 hypothetical protein [Alienimonas chondri]